MFFGREDAARELGYLIRLHPIVAVSAPSGVGKTSLLRAAVVPELEIAGLSPVYMRPDPKPETGSDGALALLDGRLEAAVVGALIPEPALELACLKVLGEQKWTDLSLQQAADRFRRLNPADPLRGRLLDCGRGFVERLPLSARYLNGTYRDEALAAQWNEYDPRLGEAFANLAPLKELATILGSPEVAERVASVRAGLLAGRDGDGEESPAFGSMQLLTSGRADGFRLIRPDGDDELKPRIVLVIDQFEQVFTLSHADNRDRLLEALAELADKALPVHIVLSLRKEWFAELSRFVARPTARSPVRPFETFHLDSMRLDEAREIMVEVPRSVGEPPIGEDAQATLWDDLQEDGQLDPVALSIACHELFELTVEDATDLAEIHSFEVEELLAAYLDRALTTLDEDDRSEAIDILGEIAGSGTTRDFVTESRLLDAPLRDRERRRAVLQRLQSLFLIRGDSPRRDSERLFDIMHERLIAPVRSLIRTRPDVVGLRRAAAWIVQPDAARLDLEFDDLRCVLLADEWLDLDARSAAIVLSGLLRLDRHDRDKARFERLAFEHGETDSEAWYRQTTTRLARRASGAAPAETSAATRLAGGWWLTETEVQQVLFDARQGDADESTYLLLINTLVRQTAGTRTRRLLRTAFGQRGSIR